MNASRAHAIPAKIASTRLAATYASAQRPPTSVKTRVPMTVRLTSQTVLIRPRDTIVLESRDSFVNSPTVSISTNVNRPRCMTVQLIKNVKIHTGPTSVRLLSIHARKDTRWRVDNVVTLMNAPAPRLTSARPHYRHASIRLVVTTVTVTQ